jgi:outer membrane lipoprotein carrier protein
MAAVKRGISVWSFAGAAVLVMASGAVGGDEAGALRLASRIESYYRKSPGITADFFQILESRTLGRPQEEQGTVSLKPPGRMRWEYRRPRGKVAVADGTRVYLYLPEDRQVLLGKIADLDSGAVAARLLLGGAPLSSDFRVEGEPSPDRVGVWMMKLTPKAADFPYDAVNLMVEEATGAILSIRLLDPLGNRMEYRFDRIRVVRDLPDRIFTFDIPRGADVQVMGGGPPHTPAP